MQFARKHKIPPNAKRVFKGVLFDVYQWKQKQFDGSIKTFEMMKRPDTASILPIVGKSKILVEKLIMPNSSVEIIGFPGGRVNENESPELTARRELKEETGYVAKNLRLWKSIELLEKMEWTIFTFIGDCKRISKQKLDSGEKVSVKLLTFDEFLKLAFDKRFRNKALIPDLLKAYYDKKERQKLRKEIFG